MKEQEKVVVKGESLQGHATLLLASFSFSVIWCWRSETLYMKPRAQWLEFRETPLEAGHHDRQSCTQVSPFPTHPSWWEVDCSARNKERAIDVISNPQNPNIQSPGIHGIILIFKSKGSVHYQTKLTAFNVNRNYRQKSSRNTTDILDLRIRHALYSRLSFNIFEIK